MCIVGNFCNNLKYIFAQGPHSQILMMRGGGGRQRFISYMHNFSICLPKKITTFFSIPKKNPLVLFSQPKKIPPFFFVTQKNSGIFHRPKKIIFGQNFRPKKSLGPPTPPPIIKICEWGPWAFLYAGILL